jgi:hypothetical protein
MTPHGSEKYGILRLPRDMDQSVGFPTGFRVCDQENNADAHAEAKRVQTGITRTQAEDERMI